MQKFKSLFLLFTLTLFTGSVAFAQQPTHPVSCDFGVDPDEAFAKIEVSEASVDPGPVHISVRVQLGSNEPCVSKHVTPVSLYYPKGRLNIRVSRDEGEPNIRFMLLDNKGKVRGSHYDIPYACAEVEKNWSFKMGCISNK